MYIFSGTRVLAEYQNGAAPSAPTREYIYSGGSLLAKIESGAVRYYHPDQLSVRMMTRSTRPPRRTRSGQADSSGNVIGQHGHYPFGESWYQTDTTTKWFFTAGVYPEPSRRERDAESGNDYAMARYGVNRLGRFASPDPVTGSPTNPQSLNRYAYVLGDPVDHVDPQGQDPNWICGYGNDDCASNGGPGDAAPVFADWSIPGFDSGYLVDGFIPVSASLAGNLLQSGAGAECPADSCLAAGSNGQPAYQYTVYAGLGGAAYETQDLTGWAPTDVQNMATTINGALNVPLSAPIGYLPPGAPSDANAGCGTSGGMPTCELSFNAGADQTSTEAGLTALGQAGSEAAFLESGSFYLDWFTVSTALGAGGALGPQAYQALSSYAYTNPDEYLLVSDFLQGFVSPIPGPYSFGGMFGNVVGCIEIGPCLSH